MLNILFAAAAPVATVLLIQIIARLKGPKIIIDDGLDSNATNSILKIKIKSKGVHGEDFYPILAQEYFEWKHKTSLAGILAAVRLPSAIRHMELIGHEIEVQAVVILNNADADERRASEARALIKYTFFWGKFRLFPDTTTERIESAMRGHTHRANRWLSKNLIKVKSLA